MLHALVDAVRVLLYRLINVRGESADYLGQCFFVFRAWCLSGLSSAGCGYNPTITKLMHEPRGVIKLEVSKP